MRFTTVKDLKEILKKVEDDMVIVLSSDEEGNSFSPLHSTQQIVNFEEVYMSGHNLDKVLILWPN